jgi:hypothetical protein
MGLGIPDQVAPGQQFAATYGYNHDKSGGVVAIIPGGPRQLFQVEVDCADPNAGPPNKWHQCSPTLGWYLAQLGALSTAPMSGVSGTVRLTAPATPGAYGVVTVYPPDGGTIDTHALTVTTVPAGHPPPPSGPPTTTPPNPPAPGTTPPPGTGWPDQPSGVGSLTRGQVALGAGALGVVVFLLSRR